MMMLVVGGGDDDDDDDFNAVSKDEITIYLSF